MPSLPPLVEEARQRAEAILLSNRSELGLLGGGGGAYRQVWSRDSMICSLALLQIAGGAAVHRSSLATLEHYQSPLGKIPHNVGFPGEPDQALVAYGGKHGQADPPAGAEGETGAKGEEEAVVDSAHAGCIDNNLWFILGHFFHWQQTGDLDLLRKAWPALQRGLLWLRYQDSNECGLLEAHEAMDWADLFPNRYNSLYPNVLYAGAWQAMGRMAEALGEPAELFKNTARETRWKINQLLWVGPEAPKDWTWLDRERREWLYPLRLVETELVVRPYYLPYMGFRSYGDRCDVFGNCLAILLGVASTEQAGRALDYIKGTGLDSPFPVRSLDHPIQRGDPDWRDYLLLRNLNKPDHYHNGGIWPFLGGFYVAALVAAGRHDYALEQLAKLAELNRRGIKREWEFNEWAHGRSGLPMGFARQSWSAAMYIFAYEAVRQGQDRYFSALRQV